MLRETAPVFPARRRERKVWSFVAKSSDSAGTARGGKGKPSQGQKKGGKTAAVINIGSNRVRMLVSQLKKGEVSPVDLLEHPIALGHEVFSTGKVSFETLRELSSILRGFSNVLKEY